MKLHLAVRTCSAGALLSLLMLAAWPTPMLAAGESIELDPDESGVGDNVRVSGEGFDASYRKASGDWVYVYVRVYFSSERADVGDEIDDEVEYYEIVDKLEKVDKDGEWKVSFTLPADLTDGEDDEDVTGGTYYVYVTYKGDDSIVAVGECEVKELCFCCCGMWPWSRFSSSWRGFPPPWYGPRRHYGGPFIRPFPPFLRDLPDDWRKAPDDVPWPPRPDWQHPPDRD
jgi:hypothetical protein